MKAAVIAVPVGLAAWVAVVIQGCSATKASAPTVSQTATASSSTVYQAAGDITVNNGASAETIERLTASMARLESKLGPDLRSRYPQGHVLFTATDVEQVIPFQGTNAGKVKLEWPRMPQVLLSSNAVALALPDIEMQGLLMRVGHFVLPRQVGFRAGVASAQESAAIVELLEDHGSYVHIVLGFTNSVPRGRKRPM